MQLLCVLCAYVLQKKRPIYYLLVTYKFIHLNSRHIMMMVNRKDDNPQ
jgi:hypothetical protein